MHVELQSAQQELAHARGQAARAAEQQAQVNCIPACLQRLPLSVRRRSVGSYVNSFASQAFTAEACRLPVERTIWYCCVAAALGDTQPWVPSEACVAQSKAQLDEEMSRLMSELKAAKAEAQQHRGKAAAAQQALSQHDEELARLRQESEAEKQQLQAEASSMGSRLAAAEASLPEAHQQAAMLQDAAAKHDGDTKQGAERLAVLQVSALPACLTALHTVL